MRLLRFSTCVMSMALLVLAGLLAFTRRQPAPYMLYFLQLGGGSGNLYRIVPGENAPDYLTDMQDWNNFSLWYAIINDHIYYESRENGGTLDLFRTTLNGHHQEQVLARGSFMSFSPDYEWVYYLAWADNNIYSVFRERLDGSERSLIVDAYQLAECQAAPTGEWLACASSTNDPGAISVVALHDFPSVAQLRAYGRLHNPPWSSDGQWLLFWATNNGSEKLFRVAPDGSQGEALSENGNMQVVGWSPDYQWLYFVRGDLMRQAMTIGSTPEPITQGQRAVGTPYFSQEWIIFPVYPTGKEGDIYRAHHDGSDPQQVTFHSGLEWIIGPSPDGEWLYYGAYAGEEREVFRVNLATLHAEQLTHTAGWTENSGTLSPDGEWLVVSAQNRSTGQPRLTAMRADGSQSHHIFQSKSMAYEHRLGGWTSLPDEAWHVFRLLVVGVGLLGASRASFRHDRARHSTRKLHSG